MSKKWRKLNEWKILILSTEGNKNIEGIFKKNKTKLLFKDTFKTLTRFYDDKEIQLFFTRSKEQLADKMALNLTLFYGNICFYLCD